MKLISSNIKNAMEMAQITTSGISRIGDYEIEEKCKQTVFFPSFSTFSRIKSNLCDFIFK